MKIFLYEFITGGGLLGSDDPLTPSLFEEGAAMISALAADFCALQETQVSALRDRRFTDFHLPGCQVQDVGSSEEERRQFHRLASEADSVVIIAPEFDDFLFARTEWVGAAAGRLLSPSSDIVALTADKQKTSAHLAAAGVPVPEARTLAPGERLPVDFPYPAVCKPIHGAGSLDVWLISDAHESAFFRFQEPRLLERFAPGTPASVAVLCGPGGHVALPACRQYLTSDGRLRYLGGSLPLDPPLAQRAGRLAVRAVATLDRPTGYLGVDLVLGEEPSGVDDVVIEINPRLTTSYVGLRAATDDNLAAAMLAIAQGRAASLSFRPDCVEFDSDGTVHS